MASRYSNRYLGLHEADPGIQDLTTRNRPKQQVPELILYKYQAIDVWDKYEGLKNIVGLGFISSFGVIPKGEEGGTGWMSVLIGDESFIGPEFFYTGIS